MININLLPKQQKDEVNSKRFNLYLTSITTIVLFLVGLLILGLFFLKITLANQTKNLDKNLEEKKKASSEYDEQKNLIDEFNSSVALAGQLIQKEVDWLDILKDIEGATPEKVRLTEISFGTGEGGKSQSQQLTISNQITFTGIAESQREIVKFIKKLDQSKYFSNVRLVSSESASESSEEEEKTSSYNFDVSAQLNEQGSGEND